MLHRSEELKDFRIRAIDGEIGKVEEFYFEDTTWLVRYVIVNTGSWLIGNPVLLSPFALGEPDTEERVIPANLTREQVKNSPDIGSDRPLSRQHEHALHAYYGWPLYWGNPGIEPGFVPLPPINLEPPPEERYVNKHLRSSQEVSGYRVRASDGESGHVEDLIIDTATWNVRYFVINAGSRRHEQLALVSTKHVGRIALSDREVWLNLSRNEILNSPEYDPSVSLNREHSETRR